MQHKTVFETNSPYGTYKVEDTVYGGRPARVLYSGTHAAAQSGVARDDNPDLLFDYNQRFIELITGTLPSSVLLIGGAACTLPTAIAHDLPEVSIDIVELDPALITIAQDYFDFVPTKSVQVHIGDGREYIKNSTKRYDLILLDAFTHADVPRVFQTVEAMREFKHCLNPNGIVAINVIAAYYGTRSALLRRIIAALQIHFKHVRVSPAGQNGSLWLAQNFVAVAHNRADDVGELMRYAALYMHTVDDSEAVHDA